MPITALYASLLAPLFLVLSVRVIGQRRAARVAVGPGDDPLLLRRMRVHANFAEYAPLALILLALAESLAAPSWALHVAGATLLAGRYVHAYGVSQTPETFTLRVAGMVMTFAAISIAALLCFVLAISRVTG